MLDEKSGIQFLVGHYRGLFNALPLNVISGWLHPPRGATDNPAHWRLNTAPHTEHN